MIVEMTKRQVIEVLRKEKLTHMTYGHGPSDAAKASDPRCSMCAVGQVVRAAMSTAASISQVCDAAYATSVGADAKRLVALSNEFEKCDGYRPCIAPDDGSGRARAISYVKRRFPAKVLIDIGSAKPRRGMKVVG